MNKKYEDLDRNEKIKLINNTLVFFSYKPSLIGDVKNETEYLDRMEHLAKLLHERFPSIYQQSVTAMKYGGF